MPGFFLQSQAGFIKLTEASKLIIQKGKQKIIFWKKSFFSVGTHDELNPENSFVILKWHIYLPWNICLNMPLVSLLFIFFFF